MADARFSALMRRRQRPDERTRTAHLLQLRVINKALQGCAGGCRCRIFRGIPFPWLAACCTVLRSGWCQGGVKTLSRWPLRAVTEGSKHEFPRLCHLLKRKTEKEQTAIP